MKRKLTALTVAVSFMASGALALDPADLKKLKETGECMECDLSAAGLSRTRLRSAKLKGADLRRANMSGADLFIADLSGADLSGANLSGANLNGTFMNGAILCNTTMPDGSVIYSGC